MDFLQEHLFEIISLLASGLSFIVVVATKLVKTDGQFEARFARVEERLAAMERDLPREITRLETDLTRRLDKIDEAQTIMMADIKSLLRNGPK